MFGLMAQGYGVLLGLSVRGLRAQSYRVQGFRLARFWVTSSGLQGLLGFRGLENFEGLGVKS